MTDDMPSPERHRMDHSMKLGSFCTGIGGLDIAVEQVFNATPVWFCEYDEAPSKVLAHHWPHVPNHGDLTATDWASVEPVDIVTAGYPCQPFSTAGQRQGTEDERHLWPAIRNAISILGPRYVVLENVRGHISLGFDAVLGDLACLGFDAEWGIVRSSDIGAPHRRERLFVVAYSRSMGRSERPRPSEGEPAQQWGHGPGDSGGETTSHADSGRRDGWSKSEESGMGRGHGVPPIRSESVSEPTGSTGQQQHWGRYADAIRRWERIFGTAAPAPLIDAKSLNPALPEWMMGYPDGWVTDTVIGLTRAQQLKAIGNSVQSQAAYVKVRELAKRLAFNCWNGSKPDTRHDTP